MFQRPYFPLLFLVFFTLVGCQNDADKERDIVNFEEYRGQWVIIHYWAEWCRSCMVEIADLNEIQADFPVKVFGFNADGLDRKALQILSKKVHIEYEQLMSDPKMTLGLEPLRGIPTLYLISPEGVLVGPLEGPQSKAKIVSYF